MLTDRNKLRAMTLGKRQKFRSKLVVLPDVDGAREMRPVIDATGAEVLEDGKPKMALALPPLLDEAGKPVCAEVREPTIKQRAGIFRAAKAQGGSANEVEVDTLQVEALLQCTFVPGTEQLWFEPGDRAVLLEQRAGGWADELAQAILPMLNVETEAIEKNSKGTASA